MNRFSHRLCWYLPRASNYLVASMAMGLAVAVAAHADPIYKCGNGADGIVYTDTPCKGGERLEIQAGVANPAAVERLQEARKALDQSADRRLAAQQAASAAATSWLPRYAAPYSLDAPVERADDYPYADFGYAPGWYVPVIRPRSHRPRPPVDATPRFAPRPPYTVPRH